MANSYVTRFFWWCVDADVEVLEQCPTDQRRFTTYGAIIFLVACLATISMFIAMTTVIRETPESIVPAMTPTIDSSYLQIHDSLSVESKSLSAGNGHQAMLPGNGGVSWLIFWARLGVALIWGMLILLIDRLMVSSLDLRDNRWQKFLSVTPRILLACFIALTISQPIEIEFFWDDIQVQVRKNNIKILNQEIDKIKEANNFRGDSVFIASTDSLITKRLEDSDNRNFGLIYKGARDSLDHLEQIFSAHSIKLKNYRDRRARARRETRQDGQTKHYLENGSHYYTPLETELTLINNQEAEYKRTFKYKDTRPILRISLERLERHFHSRTDSIQIVKFSTQSDLLEKQKASFPLQKDLIDNLRKRQNSFSANLEGLHSLEGIVNWAKWIIILLFFIIEILPITSKLLTKSGGYEPALENKRKSDGKLFEENLKVRDEIFKAKLQAWKQEELSTLKENTLKTSIQQPPSTAQPTESLVTSSNSSSRSPNGGNQSSSLQEQESVKGNENTMKTPEEMTKFSGDAKPSTNPVNGQEIANPYDKGDDDF